MALSVATTFMENIQKKSIGEQIHKKSNASEALAKFIFDELIRLLIIGFRHDEKSKKLLYILSIVPVNRKIRLFLHDT